MRVSNQAVGQQLIYEMGRSFGRMNLYRLQVASGKRVNSFADDPRGVGTIKRFDALTANNDQYLRNVGAARSFLEAVDSTLQDMGTTLIDLRQVMLQELGPLSDPNQTQASIEAVRGLRDMMLSLANQQVENSYVFGGYRTDRAPFTLLGDSVNYVGDSNVQEVQVGPTLRLAISLPGEAFMGTDAASLAGQAELRPRVRPTTALSDLNGGDGVSLGRIEISSAGAPGVIVDLTGAATVQDVITAINASGAGVTASLTADETGLQITGLEPLSVAEVSGGSTAQDLGLIGTSTTTTLTGLPIPPTLDMTDDFAEIRALDGELPLGILRLRIGDTVTDVDLSGANNFGEVRAAIQALVPDMDLNIVDGGLELELGRPEPFSVESPQGDATASVLGLVGQASPARLFELFENVIRALETDNKDLLRQSLVELDDVHANILSQNVSIGARQQTLDQSELLLRERGESMKLQRSRIEDVDLIEAATLLSFAETAYQAALASSAGIFRISLLNYL